MKKQSTHQPLVSIVVPTKNSDLFLDKCLRSITFQTFKNIEIIVVDNNSTDQTLTIARRYTKTIISVNRSKHFHGLFSATHQRNLGVNQSKGEVIYYVDADMELAPTVVSECVSCIQDQHCQAVIIPEDSVGSTFWARCKQLERRCYWGDTSIEAPRCVLKQAWISVGGLDESVGGGGDDWDLHQKLIENGYSVGRISALCTHHEGELSLAKLIRKRFLYGKESLRYISKRKGTALAQYFPIRLAFFRNWRLFVDEPIVGFGTVIMRLTEYGAGAAGILYSRMRHL